MKRNAGGHLLGILQKMSEHTGSLEGDPLMLLWTRDPLPEGMDLNIRLMVRGLHVVIFHKLRKPIDYIFRT